MVFNMKLFVFSVFDSKAAFFGNPICDQRVASAVRSFTDACNASDDNGFTKHPEDYSLFILGEFDNETGEFDCSKPRNIMTASSARASVLPAPDFNSSDKHIAVN